MADPNLEHGTVGKAFGRYQVLSKLGQGGMGTVYLAHDVVLDRRVALKFLSVDLHQDPLARRRFVTEARLAAALDHPYICKIFETGIADDRVFIALEYVQGETLQAALARGPISTGDAVQVAIEIAEAIQEAHRNEVVHRDLKPSNIMLTRDRHVKVMDFGVAIRVASDKGTDAPTRTDDSAAPDAGTLLYMAPEQLRGRPADPRSDIFAIGLVFYQMLAGVHPFRRSTSIDTASAILNDPFPALSTLGDRQSVLPAVMGKLLAKEPEVRYQTATALLADLRRLERDVEAPAQVRPVAASSDDPSIAVLPFVDLSEEGDQAHFSEGLSEELINALGHLETVRVAARSSTFRFRNTAMDAREVGQLLNVRHVLEGSVRRAGSILRVSVRLVDAHNGYQLWSERYDRELKDTFAIQEDIAGQVANTLQPTLAAQSGHRTPVRHTQDVAAYNLYLRGRYHWNKRTGDSMRKSIEAYEQALLADPRYALAYAGLADAYVLLAMHGNLVPRTVCPKAKRAAERALELDSSLGAAHGSLGYVLAAYDWNWTEAEREFKRGLELSPDGASIRALYGICCLVPQRRFDEALAQLTRAVELEPLSPSINTILAGVFHDRQEYDRAISQLEKVIELEPEFYFAHWNLGRAYSLQGRHEQALPAFERACLLNPNSLHVRSLLAREFAQIGREAEAHAILSELVERSTHSYVPAIGPAMIYFALRDYDSGFRWLARSIEEREIWAIWTSSSPFYNNVRTDPRFVRLLEQLGLASVS